MSDTDLYLIISGGLLFGIVVAITVLSVNHDTIPDALAGMIVPLLGVVAGSVYAVATRPKNGGGKP